jgi:putative NADPH-quinone reductase
MAKIAIIVGHSQRDTFCEALAQAYRRGAAGAGHEVKLFALSRMSFDPVLREGYNKIQPLEPDLAAARQALGESSHIVILFPLWVGDMPAILKGFLERVLQPDLIARMASGDKGSWRLFQNKSARVVITMGMPVPVYRWWFGAHALKILKRNILQFVGIKPVRATLFGMIGNSTPAKRRQWLSEIEALGFNAN